MFKNAFVVVLAGAMVVLAAFGLVGCRNDSDKGPVSSLGIGTATLATASVGLPYSQTLTMSGAFGSVTWALDATSDPLPVGLSLNPTTGVISGTPTNGTQGGYLIVIRATDEQISVVRSYGLAVNPAALSIITSTLPTGTEGQAYAGTVQAVGGTGGPYSYSVDSATATSLPPAIQLAGATGQLSGTPGLFSAGTYNITFSVFDGAATATKVLPLTVVRPPLNLSSTGLPYAVANVPYVGQLSATGGTYSYAWGISPATDSQLPAGLALDVQTGTVTGTVATGDVGDYNVTFTVFDGEKTNFRAILVRVLPLAVTLNGGAMQAATENQPYSHTIAAVGGSGNYTYTVAAPPAQQLPAGLTLDANTGVVSGTLAFDTAGSYSITFVADDGQATDPGVFTLTVADLDPATLLPALMANGGGMAGGAITAGGAVRVAAIDSLSGATISGIGVVRSTTTGAVASSSVTSGSGEALLVAGDVPQSITFIDPHTGTARTFSGSPQAPLREAIVAAMPFGPRMMLTVSGIPAGNDLVVTLNGREVAAIDNASTVSELVDMAWLREEDMVVGAGQPWVIIAHAYADSTPGSVDRAVLNNAAWMTDSDGGTAADGVSNLSLNVANGTGTAGAGLNSGVAATQTLAGQITRPGLSAGAGATARITFHIDTSMGTAVYSQQVATPVDPILQFPPLGPEYSYSLQIPNFTSVIGLTVSGHTRLVDFTVAAIADTLQALSTPGFGAVVTSRTTGTGAPAGGAIDLSTSLPELQLVTAYVNLSVDGAAGQALDSVTAELTAMLDADTWITSTAQTSGNSQMAFRFIAGMPGTPMTYSSVYVGLGADDSQGVLWPGGAGVSTSVPMPVTLTLSGDGSTGAQGNGVVVGMRLSGSALNLTPSLPAGGTTFSLTSGQFGWLGSGLESRSGLYRITLGIPADGGGTREWVIEAPSGATQLAGVQSYQFAMPRLPATLPHSAAALTAAMNAMSVSIEFIDTTETGIDLLQRRYGDFPYPRTPSDARRLSPGERAAQYARLWGVDFDSIADVDPVA